MLINKVFGIAILITSFLPEGKSQGYDFSWLTGTWAGSGFGGHFEETWSEPDSNAQLIGMFRFTQKNGEVGFYEFWKLDSTGLKLRHFNPDFTAWESKDDYLHFKMVEAKKDTILLKGLEYYLTEPDEMEIRLDMKHSEDNIRTEVFKLKKQ